MQCQTEYFFFQIAQTLRTFDHCHPPKINSNASVKSVWTQTHETMIAFPAITWSCKLWLSASDEAGCCSRSYLMSPHSHRHRWTWLAELIRTDPTDPTDPIHPTSGLRVSGGRVAFQCISYIWERDYWMVRPGHRVATASWKKWKDISFLGWVPACSVLDFAISRWFTLLLAQNLVGESNLMERGGSG